VTARASRRLATAIAVWTVVTLVAVLVEAPVPLRVAVVVPFVLVAPGLGWAARFVPGDVAAVTAIGIGLSVGAAMLVGQTLALAGWWSPLAGLGALAAIAGAGAAVHSGVAGSISRQRAARSRRSRP
jgi:hypothetical protein